MLEGIGGGGGGGRGMRETETEHPTSAFSRRQPACVVLLPLLTCLQPKIADVTTLQAILQGRGGSPRLSSGAAQRRNDFGAFATSNQPATSSCERFTAPPCSAVSPPRSSSSILSIIVIGASMHRTPGVFLVAF